MSETATSSQGSNVPPIYAQVNPKPKNKVTPATNDEVSRVNAGKQINPSLQAGIDNVLYSAVVDDGRSSAYFQLQQDDRPKQPSKAVIPAKLNDLNTKRCAVLVVIILISFVILLVCMIGVTVSMNAEISKLRSQYNPNATSLQESPGNQRSADSLLAISRLYKNISHLQNCIESMQDDLNASCLLVLQHLALETRVTIWDILGQGIKWDTCTSALPHGQL